MNISSINGIETKNIQRINKIYTSQIKSVCGAEISMQPFKTLWSIGAGQSITLPLVSGYSYNCTVDWGDGTSNYIDSYNSANRIHTYSSVGEYVVSIKGICEGWNFQTVSTSRLLITKVLDFGEVEFKNLSFHNCSNLNEINGQINGSNITNFQNCFYSNQLTSIPENLFDNCTQVANFSFCFFNNQLTSIPENLFDNNTLVTNFSSCFYNNRNLKLNKYIFYSEGQQSTRFLNQSVNFRNCFSRDSYISPDAEGGEAPDLWNCDFGTGTPTKAGCFGGNGNNAITLTNYTSIPSEWK